MSVFFVTSDDIMSTRNPTVIQNENLNISRGKAFDGGKADHPKTLNTKNKGRVALSDLSNARKPPPSKRAGFTAKNSSNPGSLTDEEIKKCHEWAKEGFETASFTGTDQARLDRERKEELVEKEVKMIMSSLRGWTDLFYDLGLPETGLYPGNSSRRVTDYDEDTFKLGLQHEYHLPPIAPLRPHSGLGLDSVDDEDDEDIIILESNLGALDDPHRWPSVDFKLKDDLSSDETDDNGLC